MTEPVKIGDNVTLYLGDCLDVMREIPAGSVDAVVTDPPYSSGGQFRGDRMGSTSSKYNGWSANADGSSRQPTADYPEFTGDNRDQRGYLYWCALWLSECRRILRPGGVVMMFTDWRQLPTTTDAIQAGGLVWRGVVVWDKGIGRPVKGRFRNHVEYVCWGTSGPMTDVNDVYPSSVFRATPPTHTARVHRTEKPTELLAGLMQIVSEGGTVFDPFMGSGTTGVACVQTGRNFIGIEIDPTYFAIAEKRIREAMMQPTLEGIR
jgi:site-specific DNA-methyltransferase (adenine-specific)